MARALIALFASLLAGCELAGTYFNETAGISPARLAPLYFQERQYTEDRELEGKVRGALAARGLQAVEVDVYLKDVTLSGPAASREAALAAARGIWDVKSVRYR